MRISNFLLMFAVISLFVGVLGVFYAGISANYSKAYDNSSTATFEKFQELEVTTKSINTSITEVSQGEGDDVVGGLLRSGYTVLKTTWGGFNTYTEIADDGLQEARLGPSTTYFKAAAYFVGMLLFIFAVISVLTGREGV